MKIIAEIYSKTHAQNILSALEDNYPTPSNGTVRGADYFLAAKKDFFGKQKWILMIATQKEIDKYIKDNY